MKNITFYLFFIFSILLSDSYDWSDGGTILGSFGNLSSATNGGTPRDEWTGFTLSFSIDSDLTGGSYTASGIPSDEGADLVWSTSGTFTANSDLSVLTRNDGVVMTMVASATALNISFNINDSGGRIAGFTGDWVFSMRP